MASLYPREAMNGMSLKVDDSYLTENESPQRQTVSCQSWYSQAERRSRPGLMA